jgi:aminomethyltransferase
VALTGLGARDSFRLEAGMCLYGQDLNEEISPVEAGLSWVIGKARKEGGGFIGAETVLQHLKNGPPTRRVGLIVDGVPARRAFFFLLVSGAFQLYCR